MGYHLVNRVKVLLPAAGEIQVGQIRTLANSLLEPDGRVVGAALEPVQIAEDVGELRPARVVGKKAQEFKREHARKAANRPG